jgi:hypothetical protein
MLQDEETIKLYAAGYDEDDTDEVIDLDSLDEEDEEEEFNVVSTHIEEAEIFAPPPTPIAPYEPPTRLSVEPTPSAPPPAAPRKVAAKKAPAKKAPAKKAAKRLRQRRPSRKQ